MQDTASTARGRARALVPATLAFWLAAQHAEAEPTAGVITYAPAFFAAQHPANASEMLARIPGFTLDYGASVRGLEGAGGNVLVDGQRPVSKSDNLDAILSRIPANQVERIDVIRGGAPGIDMRGKAMIANVVLRKNRGLRAQLEISASQLPDGRTVGSAEWQASGGFHDQAWEISGVFGKGYSGLLGQAAGLEISAAGAARRSRIDTEDDGRLEQLTGAYELPVAGGRLRLNGLAYHDDLKFEEDDVDLVIGSVDSTDQLAESESGEVGATFNRTLSARANVELVGLRRTNGLDLASTFIGDDSRQRFEIGRDTREGIARVVVRFNWTDALSGEVGGEAAENRLRSRARFRIDDADIPLPAGHVRASERRTEVFAKASWRASPAWNLDGQLRYERSTLSAAGDAALAKRLGFLKPRLLATWSPNEATQVRLRLERDVGQLDFDAFVAEGRLNSATGVTAGNPDLEPERAWVVEAAIERRFWGRGALIVTATHSEVRGVVDRAPVFTPTGVFDRPANIGDGSRQVVRADLTLPLEPFGLARAQLKGSLTRRWSEVIDPTTLTPRRISALKPVEWEAKFSQDLPARNLTWGVELYGGHQRTDYRFNAIDIAKLDPFLMTYVEWRPRANWRVRAELTNITERGYRQTTVTYEGVRDEARAAPAALSDRDFHFGRIVYIRLRRTFGG